jgi:hypothetical protein
MMHAVGCYPKDGSAFKGECGTDGKEVFHPLGGFVASMGEEAMVAHADPEASGKPTEEYGQEEGLPTEHEQCGDGAEVERNHHQEGDPDYGLSKSSIVSE